MDDDLPPDTPEALAERARAWRATGDPRALWPGLDVPALQPAADEIGRAVAAVIEGRGAALGRADGGDAHALGIAALVSGVGPLLGAWVEGGRLDAAEPTARVLGRHLTQGRLRMERIQRELHPALASLQAHGIRPAVIKGMHTAHVYFDEPGVRPLADVDVLVGADERPRAEQALRTVGFQACAAERPALKREWLPPGDDGAVRAYDVWHARSTWKLELHTRLAFGHLVEHDIQLDRHVAFDGQLDRLGVPVAVARQPLLLAMLATHASGELYAGRLLRLVELVLVVRRDLSAGLLDWRAVEARLGAANALRFAHPALALVEQLAPGTIEPRLLAATRRASTRRTLAVMRRFTPTFPVIEGKLSLAERLMWAATPRQVLGRAARMILPPPGRTRRELMDVYHVRLRRLLAGAVRWRPAP